MKARNIYILMGHHPSLFQNEAYKTLFRNSILWAAESTPEGSPHY
jgi:type 1 glutamine amidotransferase